MVIHQGMKRVLGAGFEEPGAKEVVGAEPNKEVTREDEKYLDQVVVGDVEQITLPFSKSCFDCLVYGAFTYGTRHGISLVILG